MLRQFLPSVLASRPADLSQQRPYFFPMVSLPFSILLLL